MKKSILLAGLLTLACGTASFAAATPAPIKTVKPCATCKAAHTTKACPDCKTTKTVEPTKAHKCTCKDPKDCKEKDCKAKPGKTATGSVAPKTKK